MRLIYLGYFIQIKIWLINSKFNKKKEKQNLKNSTKIKIEHPMIIVMLEHIQI